MKRFFLLIMALCITAGLTGCGKPGAGGAQKFGDEFLNKLYTFHGVDKIIDQVDYVKTGDSFGESFRAYTTEEGYVDVVANRECFRTLYAAFYNKCSVDPGNITLKLVSSIEGEGLYSYDYTVDISLTPLNGGEVKKVQATGQMTIIYKDGKCKVNSFIRTGNTEWDMLSRAK